MMARKQPRQYRIVNGHRYRAYGGQLKAVTTPGCACQGCERRRRYAEAKAKDRRAG